MGAPCGSGESRKDEVVRLDVGCGINNVLPLQFFCFCFGDPRSVSMYLYI